VRGRVGGREGKREGRKEGRRRGSIHSYNTLSILPFTAIDPLSVLCDISITDPSKPASFYPMLPTLSTTTPSIPHFLTCPSPVDSQKAVTPAAPF